jgi:uncharacterized membrane protein
MAYALIPDGYSLKKVTKLEEAAVNSKRRHDDIVALLENSNTPLVVGGLITAFFAVKTAGNIISDLEDKGIALTEQAKDAITETVAKAEKELITDPQTWVATQLTGLVALGARIGKTAKVVI